MTRPPKVRTLLEDAAAVVAQAIVSLDRDDVAQASALVYHARRTLGTARGLLVEELEVRRRVGPAQELAEAHAGKRGGRP